MIYTYILLICILYLYENKIKKKQKSQQLKYILNQDKRYKSILHIYVIC